MVIFKVAESVSLSLQHLQLGVETFGDPVMPREAPHRGDLHGPASEGMAELHQLCQAAIFQLMQRFQKPIDQFGALFPRAMLFNNR